MDTCLSCYFQRFEASPTLAFANNLSDLGFYHREYERLMRHWHEVLPTPPLDVVYEDMVADQETVSRKMIDFIGLDWEDSCLNYQDNANTVKTASRWQVRQPIYTSSVKKWQRYEDHLGPLKAALQGA